MTVHKSGSELLPCPFCGNEPEYRNEDQEDFMHEICCYHWDITMMASAVGNLVEAWNTRQKHQ